jgi:hypothetical protein
MLQVVFTSTKNGFNLRMSTAGIQLFQIVIEPGVGVVEGWRNLSGPESYRLSVAGQPDWFMTPQTAARLGRAAKRLLRALSKSAGDAQHAGPVFSGRSSDGALMIEIELADADAIFASFGDTPKLRLTGDQATALLEAFALFDDISIPAGPVRHVQLAIGRAQMFETWDWWR